MTDPGIATHDFLDENLDSHDGSDRLDTEVGAPRKKRWGGGKGPCSPRSEANVAAKKLWQSKRASLGAIAFELPLPRPRFRANPDELVMALGLGQCEDREVRIRRVAMRVLEVLVDTLERGFDTFAVSSLAVATDIRASVYSTGSAVRWLVEHQLVIFECQTHERHGDASSARAKAYTVPPHVRAGIARCSAKVDEHPERIPSAGRVLENSTPHARSENAPRLSAESSPAAPAAGSVSASPTVDFSSAVPDAATDVPCPEARQGESCDAPLTAPDAGGCAARSHMQSVLRQLKAELPFAAELEASWEARQRKIEAYAKPEPLPLEVARQRAVRVAAGPSPYVVGDDLELGGDS
jgi:hypothetical protein